VCGAADFGRVGCCWFLLYSRLRDGMRHDSTHSENVHLLM
jgi:hypothetical protein